MSPGDVDRKASPARMSEHADRLHQNVDRHLQLAWNDLQTSRDAVQGGFTATSYVLAMACAEAVEFAEEDLETKKKVLNKFRELLKASSTNWRSAEVASTLGRP
jgi:hypothetical protein